MGHGPRGLQRRRRRLELLQPRPGALARLPLGRGRPRRASRDDQQRLCFALALWNGNDPILKERLFGLTNSEGNHGEDVKEYYFYLDATPTHSYMQVPLQVPAGGVSRTTTSSRPTAAASRDGARVRAARHRRLRRATATSTSFVEYAKASPEDILIRDHGRTTAARSRRRCTCCRRSGSATPGPGAATPRGPSSAAAGDALAVDRRPRIADLGERYLLRATARADCCSPRTRPTPSGSSARPTGRRTSRTASTTTSSTAGASAVNPAADGTKAAAHYPLDRARPASRDGPAPAARSATPARGTGPFGAAFDARRRRRAAREADEFYAAVIPAVARRRRGQRHAPGAGRDAVDQAVLLLRRRPLARGARRRSVQPRQRAARAQRRTGTTCTTPTSSRCPTSGSIPGTRRGTWPSTSLALTLVDPDFGKEQLDLMLRDRLPAPERPAPGLRVELRRRQSAGARLGDDLHLPARAGRSAARATSTGSSASFHKLLLNFTWWVNRKDRDGQQRLRGRLPRASTTSASSTAARRCHRRLPRAGRRHRLDGALLPEHARDRRRAGAAPTRPTWTWRSSSSSTSSGSRRR